LNSFLSKTLVLISMFFLSAMPWSQNFLVVPSFCLQGNSHYRKRPRSRALATAFVQSAAFNLKKSG